MTSVYNNHRIENRTYTASRSARYAHESHTRRYQRNRSRLMFVVIAMIIVITGLVMFLHPKTEGIASAGKEMQTLYKSVLIEEGMTLSSIAEEYDTNALVSRHDYIEEVKTINHINDNEVIHSGNYITVPYYVEVDV